MDSEQGFKTQWHSLLIINNLKLISFAFSDESMALLLRVPIMVFFLRGQGYTFLQGFL